MKHIIHSTACKFRLASTHFCIVQSAWTNLCLRMLRGICFKKGASGCQVMRRQKVSKWHAVNSHSIGTLKIRLGIYGEGGLTSGRKWPCKTVLFGNEVSCLCLACSTEYMQCAISACQCYHHNFIWFETEKQYCQIN